MIRFDNVSIVFGQRPQAALPLMDEGLERGEIQARTRQILGVHDCSLEVMQGEISVLMGLSGSGKSTLLRAVNGLNRVTRGAMWVHDGERLVDTACADPATLRRLRTRRVSMVFQQFGLLPWRSVVDNVAFGLEVAGVPPAERRERALAQLETVKLGDWAECRVQELSGGMQQRVGLARAFATGAPILLMDEPFSALDPLIRAKLQDELLELQARLKRTIVFVSHDLDEAVKIGTHIAIMAGGRIVQTGRPDEIVLKPANDYVAEFVAHLNPLAVLCASDVMRAIGPGEAPASLAAAVPKDRPVRDLLPELTAGFPHPLVVVDDGRPVGLVGPGEVISALVR
jgi:glycine betaine/proline transport system ATP-binding protein